MVTKNAKGATNSRRRRRRGMCQYFAHQRLRFISRLHLCVRVCLSRVSRKTARYFDPIIFAYIILGTRSQHGLLCFPKWLTVWPLRPFNVSP